LGTGATGNGDENLVGAGSSPDSIRISATGTAFRVDKRLGEVGNGYSGKFPNTLLDIAFGKSCLV
jgi:hypothetical protein